MTVSFALRDVLLEQYNDLLPITDPAQPWRTIGFDVDNIETSSEASPTSCRTTPTPDSGLVTSFPIDGVNGIDNAFGSQLVPQFVGGAAPNLQNDVCCFHQRGRGTIILNITQWNGQPNDAQVSIALLAAADGTSEQDLAGVTWSPGMNQEQLMVGPTPASDPLWEPDKDTYYISTRDVSGGSLNSPKHLDTNGYIREGYLVMTLNSAQPVKLYLGYQQGISIGLQGGRLLAHISSDGRFLDSGTLGGRMGQSELKEASLRLLASGANQTTCNSIVNDIIDPLITNFGDVITNGDVNADAPCDALSVGVRFRGVRTRGLDVAGGYLCVPYPDCDGNYDPCDPTADEVACPFGSGACTIPAWTGP